MTALALLMAGGMGERMRASGEARPKPLVAVGGATLLERNLFLLLGAGFMEIVVSVPTAIPEIGAFARSRGHALVAAAGGRLSLLEEEIPLGNVGCAGRLAGEGRPVLVVYADNLTTLDLRAVVSHHEAADAALTLAAHEFSYRLPYGELRVEGGEVLEYREKPEWRPLVASAVSVLGPRALAEAGDLTRRSTAGPVGLVDLFEALRRAGQRVVAYRHGDAWVDVNDRQAVERAEDLIATQPAVFEQWWPDPAQVIRGTLELGPDGQVELRRSNNDIDRSDGAEVAVLDDLAGDEIVRYRVRVEAGETVTRSALVDAARGELSPVARRAWFHATRRLEPPGQLR